MAKVRAVKPDFWTDERVVSCSPLARLLLIGLWNFCDDAGRHPANVQLVKLEVLPADSHTIEEIGECVCELEDAGLIKKYTVDGRDYWYCVIWHQKGKTERYPAPPEFLLDGICKSNPENGADLQPAPTPPIIRRDVPQELLDLWNARAERYKGEDRTISAARMTPERRSKFLIRLRDPGFEQLFHAALQMLPQQSRNFDWQPNLDFLLKNSTNTAKVAEGAYGPGPDQVPAALPPHLEAQT